MAKHIYENSFVILVISFIILCILFYVFDVRTKYKINEKGEITRTLNWKDPLVLSLAIFVLWYFVIYPPAKQPKPSLLSPVAQINMAGSSGIVGSSGINRIAGSAGISRIAETSGESIKSVVENIHMNNWN